MPPPPPAAALILTSHRDRCCLVLHEKYFEERAVSSARSRILHPDLKVPKKKKAAPEREDVWEVYNERASRRCSLAEIKAQILMRGVPLGYAKTKEPLLKLWETNSALEDKRFVVQPARAAAGSGGGGAAAVASSVPVAARAGGSASIHAVSSGVSSVSAILPVVNASKRVCSKCKKPGHQANSTKCLQHPDNVSKTAAARGGPRSPSACARGGGAQSPRALSADSSPVRRAFAALGSTDQRVQCAEK